MKDVDVLWLCTCQERPVGLVKAYDEIEECWKFYVGIGHGLDPEADVREIMRCGQKYEALGFLTKLCGFDAVSDVQKEDPRWISVKERLPKAFDPVIVCREGAEKGSVQVEQGRLDVNGWWKVYGTRTKHVTHWMSLPEPPAPEE